MVPVTVLCLLGGMESADEVRRQAGIRRELAGGGGYATAIRVDLAMHIHTRRAAFVGRAALDSVEKRSRRSSIYGHPYEPAKVSTSL